LADSLRESNSALFMGADAWERYKLARGGVSEADLRGLEILQRQNREYSTAAGLIGQMTNRLRGLTAAEAAASAVEGHKSGWAETLGGLERQDRIFAVLDQTRTPLERYNETMRQLRLDFAGDLNNPLFGRGANAALDQLRRFSDIPDSARPGFLQAG